VTPIIFNGAGTDSTFIGSMNASQMITSETIRKIGLFGVLVDDGSYGEIPFSRGDFYYFAGTGEPDSINGWKFCTDKVAFTNTALSAGYNFTDSRYIGYFQTYSQMTHISPPRYGSICLVLDNYSEDSVDYPPYTYFKYGYEDNQLGWWKFNPSTMYRIVDDYEGLYDLANVDEDEICIVKNPYGRESHVNAADSFMTFGTTGNVSDWKDSSECGNVMGVRDNVGNLDLLTRFTIFISAFVSAIVASGKISLYRYLLPSSLKYSITPL
jgi:hypothetical protein